MFQRGGSHWSFADLPLNSLVYTLPTTLMLMEYQFMLIEKTCSCSIITSEASIFSIEGYAAEISLSYHEAISC